MHRSLWVFGSGGHAKVVVATARDLSYDVLGAVGEPSSPGGGSVSGVPVVNDLERVPRGSAAVIAIGDGATRRRLAALRTDLDWVTLVHPSATLVGGVTLSAGTVVLAGAVLQSDVSCGVHAIVNTRACADHDVRIGDYAQVAPGALLAGGVEVGEGTMIGMGAVVLPGIRVGAWSTVGAGAVVTRDVDDGVMVVGSPARVRRVPR